MKRARPRFGFQFLAFHLLVLLVLTAGWTISGCAWLRRRPPAEIYGGRLIEVRRLDTSSLKGKRIVLDPGHGGAFPGAVGRGGLKEADVNLGVALYLWGMLTDAGADVFLTRSSDRDFLGGQTPSLREDLSARVDAARSFRPDLFLSLHHNADLFRSRERNQIETYFRMLDESPSKDVALLIHGRLTECLGISKGEVIPGNYFVLRNMPCAAVLGEPSYISNPWVEKKLRLAEKQLLEAQAYFLGILAYFDRGVPRVESLSPCDSVLADALPSLFAAISAQRSAIDTASVSFKLDGIAIPRTIESEGRLVKARPERPLTSGTHELCVSCRNLNGNSSGEGCCRFEVSLPIFSLKAKAWPDCLPRKGGVLVTAEARDVNGNAVEDGLPVRFSCQSGSLSAESVGTVGGVATSVFFPDASTGPDASPGPDALPGKGLIRVSCRGRADAPSLGDSLFLSYCVAAQPVFTQPLLVVEDATGEPLANAQLRSWTKDSLLAVGSPQGLMVFKVEWGEGRIVKRPGFIPSPVPTLAKVTMDYPSSGRESTLVLSGDLMPIRMRVAAAGALLDAKIAIDIGLAPGEDDRFGSGGRSGGARETANRTRDLSRDVGARLEKILVGAGAQPLVLEETLSDEEKVRRAELFGAQMYLRIELKSHGSASILHYPGSTAGTKLAFEIARSCAAILSAKEPPVKEDAHYVVRQTSCPAVIALLPISGRTEDQGFASSVAYALFLGILEDRGLAREQLAKLVVTPIGSVPNESFDVVLDDFIPRPASSGESVTFFCEEGFHLVRALSRDGRSALKFVSVEKGGKIEVELAPS